MTKFSDIKRGHVYKYNGCMFTKFTESSSVYMGGGDLTVGNLVKFDKSDVIELTIPFITAAREIQYGEWVEYLSDGIHKFTTGIGTPLP